MAKRWNQCDYCGRFLGYRELESGLAFRRMVRPDTPFNPEVYETFHRSCHAAMSADAGTAEGHGKGGEDDG